MGGFAVTWVASTAAMMLPSAAPFVRTVRDGGVSAPAVVGGYLAVWTAFGFVAYESMMLVDGRGLSAGLGLVAGGAYQLTPLKHSCLRRCRSPFHFLLHRRGGLAIGLEYGAFCLACCIGLMAALLVLGMSSLFWMAVVAALIAGEKLLRSGPRLAYATSAGLVGTGLWMTLA